MYCTCCDLEVISSNPGQVLGCVLLLSKSYLITKIYVAVIYKGSIGVSSSTNKNDRSAGFIACQMMMWDEMAYGLVYQQIVLGCINS